LRPIENGDSENLCEELGDVLLQVVFHSRIEEESGGFRLDDVADRVCKKLILRHPHVFGDIEVSGSDEVTVNWDAIKRREKRQPTTTSSMDAVAKSLPALWRAEKIQTQGIKGGLRLAGRRRRDGQAVRGMRGTP
jgi:tetrapyrrole methylase family protein/MazG family protein